MDRINIPKSNQIKVISNVLLPKIVGENILKLDNDYNYLSVKTSKFLDHQSLDPVTQSTTYNGQSISVNFSKKFVPGTSAPPRKSNQPLSRIVVQKTCTDERKNLSQHHLILPNNTQICVETLLSQCVNDGQIVDRKLDAKLRARLKKRKQTPSRPINFLLKNGKLRPIATSIIRSGVFRSIEFNNNLKKTKNIRLLPSNVLYSQSTLPSRIQSMQDFSNDEWVVERTTKYMLNDWTRAVPLNANSAGRGEDCDQVKDFKTKDCEFRNETNGILLYNSHDNIIDYTQKPMIHRLVTPDGFHLNTVPGSTSKFKNQNQKQFCHSNFGINEFKHPLQQAFHTDKEKLDMVEPVHDTPICRTRFSRATRSPLQHDTDQKVKVNSSQQHSTSDAIPSTETFKQKGLSSKNESGDRNRCRTCRKLYLGRRKVIKHLKAFPDHDMQIPPKPSKATDPKSRIRSSTPPATPSTERLFDFLIQKIKNAPIDEKSHILFREISDFVEKLETIRSQLLCDDNTHSSVEYLDKHCSKIFGTQEGNYHISLDILNQLSSGVDPNEFASNVPIDANILPNQLDHNINVSLSSISESKIHLVEGISEESLLKTVDDLMRKEGRMGDGNFDHIEISDNAVEAVTLKGDSTQPILNLSLDLFKFDGT